MAKNDFKAFATDRSANVISQEEWEALPALLSGFTAGKASSAQVNKVIRQASFIAAALAQFVSDKTQRDVLDNGDLPGFVELLGSGFAVEYLSRKNPFGDIKSDGTVETALENLGLGEAAKLGAAVGVTGNTGRILIPALIDGVEQNIIFQWVSGFVADSTGLATVTLPIAFPNALLHATAIDSGASASSWNGSSGTTWGFDINGSTRTTVKVRALGTVNGTSWTAAQAAGCLLAIGY
ncbi:putative fels-2 prophage Pin [Escherichia coli 3-105-05_S4_C3]|uniref:gp53-like domain-containing protein n=1 Tax=Escherichia coli TaxID=562 RepID=UPI0004D899B2|nr:putative fels-2 prophage Pin [Escherichia coli 3-105-05_S4_C3]